MTQSVRLQRYLATAGIAARRKAEDLIVAGRVKVNGTIVTVLGTKIDPKQDAVEVDGEAVVALDHFYVVFNKPKGCITAVTDDRGRPVVMDYLPNLPVPVKPVGRLDFYSEGVLLLTNDGELAARLLAPANHVPKTYHVKVHGHLDRQHLEALRNGITLEDGTTTMPAEVEILPGESKHTWLGITLHEGKHRQIHRMIEALGYAVDKLQRVAFANLTFHQLRVGDARELTQQELNELRDMVGLDHSAVSRGRWRADREQTDIPRRARAKARAEAEAEAAGRPYLSPASPGADHGDDYDREDAGDRDQDDDRGEDGPDDGHEGRSDDRHHGRDEARGGPRRNDGRAGRFATDDRPARRDAGRPVRRDDDRPARRDAGRPVRRDDDRPARRGAERAGGRGDSRAPRTVSRGGFGDRRGAGPSPSRGGGFGDRRGPGASSRPSRPGDRRGPGASPRSSGPGDRRSAGPSSSRGGGFGDRRGPGASSRPSRPGDRRGPGASPRSSGPGDRRGPGASSRSSGPSDRRGPGASSSRGGGFGDRRGAPSSRRPDDRRGTSAPSRSGAGAPRAGAFGPRRARAEDGPEATRRPRTGAQSPSSGGRGPRRGGKK